MSDMTYFDPERDSHHPVLAVENLVSEFRTEAGIVRAVDDVSFQITQGEVFAIVGESGSGKSTVALSVLGLLPQPAGRIAGGRVLFRGEDLTKAPPSRLRSVRG